jgi:hypothetical protein
MRALTAPKVLLTLTTLGTVVAGCAGGGPTSPRADASAIARAAPARATATRRPLSGDCETAFPAPPLPLPAVLRQVDVGTCHLAHLGRAAFFSVKEINFAAGTQTITESTLTAANGDVLRAVGSGTNVPSGPGRVRFAATMTFTGGTGRFANATGQARVEGAADLVMRTATLTMDGWIAYDASGRSGR